MAAEDAVEGEVVVAAAMARPALEALMATTDADLGDVMDVPLVIEDLLAGVQGHGPAAVAAALGPSSSPLLTL